MKKRLVGLAHLRHKIDAVNKKWLWLAGIAVVLIVTAGLMIIHQHKPQPVVNQPQYKTTTRQLDSTEPSLVVNPPVRPVIAKLPSQILNLSNWYLTLPTGVDSATTIKQAALQAYQSPFFKTASSNDAVVLTAPVQGATTDSSEHTRSELRETAADGSLPWGWSATRGAHVMTATQAIDHLPSSKGKLGFAQIHGPGSTWYLILLAVGNGDGTATLSVKDQTGKANKQIIDARYVLGNKFTLQITVLNGTVNIYYNGVLKTSTTSDMADSYFKIGAYNQSDGDFGQVTLYSLAVSHR